MFIMYSQFLGIYFMAVDYVILVLQLDPFLLPVVQGSILIFANMRHYYLHYVFHADPTLVLTCRVINFMKVMP